jgi:hypothetical protein
MASEHALQVAVAHMLQLVLDPEKTWWSAIEAPPGGGIGGAPGGGIQRRLHDISLAAQDAGQFGPAVRAEELLGKSIGMFIDRCLQLSGQLNDSHVTALLELAKRRRTEPIDLADDQQEHSRGHDSDSDSDSDSE